MNTLEKIGQNICCLRKELGYSQEKLALEAGLDRTYIPKVEKGKINITINSDSRKPLDDAFILLESLDKYLSLYNPNSELNKINNNAGIKPVTTNKYVYEIINESKNIYNLTEGEQPT